MLNISTNLIITKLVSILSLTIFGYLAGKLRLITKEGYFSLSNIIIFLALPALTFTAVLSGVSRDSLLTFTYAPVFGFLIIVLMLLLAVFIGRVAKIPVKKIGTLALLCSIPNSAYIGYPIILAILGEKGLAYAVAYDAGAALALWTIVLAVLKKETKMKKNWRGALTPPLFSVLFALIIKLSGWELPEMVLEPLTIMGQTTMPLAMVAIGYMVQQMKPTISKDNVSLLITTLVKLFVYPIFTYVFLGFFSLDPTFKLVVVIIAATPCMSSAPVLAEKFGGDVSFATSGVFVTTILSVLTIPLLLYILG